MQAGKGGRGASSFRREKFVPFGGPNGGNGGRGGSIILEADTGKNTLIDFHYKPRWKAKNGGAGDTNLKDGKDADDVVLAVPVGTQIIDDETGNLVCDLDVEGQRHVLSKGGRGGKGNAHFKSATNRAPTKYQPGEEGEEGAYLLSLKLIADIGLVGFPNAGKSTLISIVSAVRPKIADYPFTTLEPNLGVVDYKGAKSFVIADIPGLIPGAHEGKGLGIKFLKHIERTKIILHLIDPNQLDDDGEPINPKDSFEMINTELASFSELLSAKQQIAVITKIDTLENREKIKRWEEDFAKLETPLFAISSVTREGLEELLKYIAALDEI